MCQPYVSNVFVLLNKKEITVISSGEKMYETLIITYQVKKNPGR